MNDSLILEVANIESDVLTGIYSEETGRPQPLRISITAALKPQDRYTPDCPLTASKNYMDLKHAASEGLPPLSTMSWRIWSSGIRVTTCMAWRRSSSAMSPNNLKAWGLSA